MRLARRAFVAVHPFTLTRLVHLHSDPLTHRALPFSLLVVDVPFELRHSDFALLAGHGPRFVLVIALYRRAPIRT